MPIETVQRYNPKHKLPLYTQISLPGHNDWNVGERYNIRVEDPDRQQEKGGMGAYNHLHESVLVCKEHMKYGDLSRILFGFDANTTSKSEAEERTFPKPDEVDEDTDIVLLVFMRLDKVKEFVSSGLEAIEPGFSKEHAEGNG